MSSPLSISGPVRRAVGEHQAAAIAAGVGLPADAQCWACGDTINLLAAAPGSVTLSAVMAGSVSITAFAHRPCGPSRVFTWEEFDQAANRKPAAVSSDGATDSAVLVNGQRVDLDHAHRFEVPADYTDPAGRPVNYGLLGELFGAAVDGCASCQDGHMALLVEDPATAARLVELACIVTQQTFGGLPASMFEEGVPGPSSPEFRRLARAGANGANDAMFVECERMTVVERRAAANTALDTLVGSLVVEDLLGG